MVKIDPSWNTALSTEFEKPYFHLLTDFVRREYATRTIYPAGKDIFRAFDVCPFNDVKVVILGQDPYHEPGQAHGLCFSVQQGVTLPPSLINIFKELSTDLGIPTPTDGDLNRWAKQGVLLLNATLTVAARVAGSHQNKGWEEFTDAAINALANEREGLVFILWGNYAQRKGRFIDTRKHLVLKSSHPSPLSANRGGFFGTRPFSKTNEYLVAHGKTPIDWR